MTANTCPGIVWRGGTFHFVDVHVHKYNTKYQQKESYMPWSMTNAHTGIAKLIGATERNRQTHDLSLHRFHHWELAEALRRSILHLYGNILWLCSVSSKEPPEVRSSSPQGRTRERKPRASQHAQLTCHPPQHNSFFTCSEGKRSFTPTPGEPFDQRPSVSGTGTISGRLRFRKPEASTSR